MIMLTLYTVVLLLAPTHILMGTRVAKAANMKAVPSIGGGLESQPSSTGHVANVQSPAPVLAMAGESRLELSEGTVIETHRTNVQEEAVHGLGWCSTGLSGSYSGPKGPQKGLFLELRPRQRNT